MFVYKIQKPINWCLDPDLILIKSLGPDCPDMAYIDFQLRHEVVKLKRAIVKVIIIPISQKSNIYSHNNHQPSATTLLSTNTSPQSPHQVLFLLFLNGSVWLVGSFLFIHLEGSTEAAHKCGSSNHFPQIHQKICQTRAHSNPR